VPTTAVVHAIYKDHININMEYLPIEERSKYNVNITLCDMQY